MNEFEQKDFASARAYAESIKNAADNILEIFNDIDNSMKRLYGEFWQSSGADVSNGRYQELRTNYENFYNKVIAMKNHIDTVTSRNENTDTSVGNMLGNI